MYPSNCALHRALSFAKTAKVGMSLDDIKRKKAQRPELRAQREKEAKEAKAKAARSPEAHYENARDYIDYVVDSGSPVIFVGPSAGARLPKRRPQRSRPCPRPRPRLTKAQQKTAVTMVPRRREARPQDAQGRRSSRWCQELQGQEVAGASGAGVKKTVSWNVGIIWNYFMNMRSLWKNYSVLQNNMIAKGSILQYKVSTFFLIYLQYCYITNLRVAKVQ